MTAQEIVAAAAAGGGEEVGLALRVVWWKARGRGFPGAMTGGGWGEGNQGRADKSCRPGSG